MSPPGISRSSAPARNPFAVAAALLSAREQEVERSWKLGAAHGWHKRNCPTCGADHGRPEQLQPPGDWLIWLILTGRGWGKTRTGAEWLAEQMEATPDSEWAVIAPKFADARTVCVEGPAGLLKVLSAGALRTYNRSTFEVTLHNGAKAFLYGAEDPRVGVRGRNLSGAWCDELSSWRYREVWDEGLMYALRIGPRPRVVVTTTPKPIALIRELTGRGDDSVHVTNGSIFDNQDNLSASALNELRERYEGTRLGRQELHGEILDDVEGAWFREQDFPIVTEIPVITGAVRYWDLASTKPGANRDPDWTAGVLLGRGSDDNYYMLNLERFRESPADTLVRLRQTARRDAALNATTWFEQEGGSNSAFAMDHIIGTVLAGHPAFADRKQQGKESRALPVAAAAARQRIRLLAGAWNAQFLDEITVFPVASGPKDHDDQVDALSGAFAKLTDGGLMVFAGNAKGGEQTKTGWGGYSLDEEEDSESEEAGTA